jgi:hypothetical protein
LDLYGDLTKARIQQAVLSAYAREVLHVRCCEILRKQLGVVSAFGGTDFDYSFHHALL